jgi:hypothetical protein
MTWHLKSDHIDKIALQLDEDVYGANGDLSDHQIRYRLMEAIIVQLGVLKPVMDVHTPSLSLAQAADLILGVWRDKDRDYMNEMQRAEKRK